MVRQSLVLLDCSRRAGLQAPDMATAGARRVDIRGSCELNGAAFFSNPVTDIFSIMHATEPKCTVRCIVERRMNRSEPSAKSGFMTKGLQQAA